MLSSLTPREERVLRMRFGIGMNTDHTLEEVGQQFNVTRERIRQIEAKALRKLKHPSRRGSCAASWRQLRWPRPAAQVCTPKRQSSVSIHGKAMMILSSALRSWVRSVLAPLATSRNTFEHPALASWRTCASTLCPSVETLA